MRNGAPGGGRVMDVEKSFATKGVEQAFAAMPKAVRGHALRLRSLILEVARSNAEIGALTETLKWGQPAYLTSGPKTGTTVRIGVTKSEDYGLYVPCSTTLMPAFAAQFGSDFKIDGARGLIFGQDAPQPEEAVRLLIYRAMTYHLHR